MRFSHHTTTSSTMTPTATTPPDNPARGYKQLMQHEPQAQNDVNVVLGQGKFSSLFHF
jgi:hypothetical protein